MKTHMDIIKTYHVMYLRTVYEPGDVRDKVQR